MQVTLDKIAAAKILETYCGRHLFALTGGRIYIDGLLAVSSLEHARATPMLPTSVSAPITPGGFSEPQADFERPIVESVVARPFRDQAFARQVRLAYDNRCAVTGLRLINGGGRAEVQAAHIRPVASAGPDSVRNGLALSGTAHWRFDRGLVAIDDDYAILTMTRGLPEDAGRLIVPDRRLRIPADATVQPHRQFLRWHRENVFKG